MLAHFELFSQFESSYGAMIILARRLIDKPLGERPNVICDARLHCLHHTDGYWIAQVWLKFPRSFEKACVSQVIRRMLILTVRFWRSTRSEEELRETIRALLRREIIEPTEDGYRILVPLIARYVRDQRQPI